jgi:hypothetical protein
MRYTGVTPAALTASLVLLALCVLWAIVQG